MKASDYLNLKEKSFASSDVHLSKEDTQALRDSLISPEYKIMDKMDEQLDNYREQSQAQLKPLIELAETTRKQADAAWKQVEIMQEQLDLAAAQAESSQKESKIALAISFASLLLSVLGLVLQNLDTLGKLFSQIMR